MKLSIVIPAHNEEQRLPSMLEEYASFFVAQLGEAVELLVVVNGSTDQTAAVARRIASDYSQIKVIDEPKRIGKGGAVILGTKHACGEWIGFADADGATSAEEFYRLAGLAEGSDGVIASRWKKGAKVNVKQSGLRRLSSRFFNGLTRFVLGLKYEDTQCGAKIFTRQAWDAILPDIGTTRFAFDVDLLFQLKRHGFTSIQEEPTVWNDVDGSTVRVMDASIEMLLAVIRMRLLYSPFRFVVRWYDRTIAKPVEFLLRDNLFRHTALLFVVSLVGMGCNIGYQRIMGHKLPPHEFFLLTTFLTIISICSRPLVSLGTTFSHYTSLLVKESRPELIGRMLLKWTGIMGGVSVVISTITIIFAHEIADYFHLNRVAPVVVSALALPVVCIAPIFSGAIQGVQKYLYSSISGIISAVGRLVIGGLFVWLVFPASGWGLAGHVSGMYLALLFLCIVLFPLIIKRPTGDYSIPSVRGYLGQSFFVQISAAILMTGDVLLVKHYLPEVSDFAYAATLGRMVVFMAAAVVGAMFPKVSSIGVFTSEHKGVYQRSLLYSCVFIMGALLMCFPLGTLFHRFLFNIQNPSVELLSLTRWLALVMAITVLLNINITLLLAQRKFKALWSVILCALLYLCLTHFYHGSAFTVLLWAGITNLVALLVTTFTIYRYSFRSEKIR